MEVFPGTNFVSPAWRCPKGEVPVYFLYALRQLKKFILTVADDPSYILRANLLWSLLIGVSSPIAFSLAVF